MSSGTTNPEIEPQWLALAEEALIFSDRLVSEKFNDIDSSPSEDENDALQSSSKSSKSPEVDDAANNIADKFVGIVHVDSGDYYRRALREFRQEVANLTSVPSDASSSFEYVAKKRLMVQKFLHAVHISEKIRRKKQKKKVSKDTSNDKEVPVVVRLGVLTLFPLIESLANIKDANYQRLCNRTLDIIIKVLTSVPALALRDEPADVLDAFRDFIFGLIQSQSFIVDTPEKAQAVTALVGLATSRGQARHLLHVIEVLFRIYQAQPSASEAHLNIAPFVKQISEFRREADFPLPVNKHDEPFFVESQDTGSESSASRGTVACDGTFLYTHSSRSGLSKVGTGLGGTIKGYVYVARADAFLNDKGLSLAWIAGELYALSGTSTPSAAAQASSEPVQEEGRVIIHIDSQNLSETRRFTVPSSVAADGCRLISAGGHAFLIGRKKSEISASQQANAATAAAHSAGVQVVPAPLSEEVQDQMEVDASDREDDDLSGSGSPSESDEDQEVDDDQDADQDEEAVQSEYGIVEPPEASIRLSRGTLSDDLSQLMANLNSASSGVNNLASRLSDLLPPNARLRFGGGDRPAEPASSEGSAPQASSSDKFVVESYEVSSGVWNLVRSVDLAFASSAPKNSSSDLDSLNAQTAASSAASKESAQLAASFEKAVFYTNGMQLVALCPSSSSGAARAKVAGNFVLSRARVFSIADGRPLLECSLVKNETSGSAACIDHKNNLIWVFSPSDRRVASFINLGSPASVARKADSDRMQVDGEEDAPASAFSAETVLAPYETTTVKSKSSKDGKKDQLGLCKPLESILLLLSNMDRLAKHHPVYSKTNIVDESSQSAATIGNLASVCIDPDRSILHSVSSILQHSLSCIASSSSPATFVFVILSSLRLLKVNIYELLSTQRKVAKTLWKDDSDRVALISLRDLLLKFIENTSSLPLPASSHEIVRQTSASVLLVGFALFYPQPSQQAQYILDRLQNLDNSFLLKYSLNHLAEWYRVSDLLAADEETTRRDGGEVASWNKLAPSVLQHMIQFCLRESGFELADLQKMSEAQLRAVASATLTLPAHVRLLLALQRDIVAPSFGKQFVSDYVNAMLQACSSFVNSVSAEVASRKSELYIAAVDSILQRSLIRVVLPALATSLCRRNYSIDNVLGGNCVSAVLGFVESLDKLNHSLPSCSQADADYLRALSGTRDKKYVVETKHPYPFGKMQYKETVSIPGAEKLVLRFDSRSRTAPGSSDSLQLFLTPSLDTPVSSLDGSPIYYNGSNFPRQPVIVPGNSITFFFTQTRIDPSTPASARWGFRCTVTSFGASRDLPTAPIQNWLLDLENSFGVVSGRFLASLIEGPSVSTKEAGCRDWLSSPILRGGFERNVDSTNNWFEQFALSSSESDLGRLYLWMKSLSKRPRPLIRKTAQEPLERVEKFIIASLIKHTGLLDRAKLAVSQVVQDASKVPEAVSSVFLKVVDAVTPIVSMLYRRGDVEKEWQLGVEDASTDFNFFSAFQSNPDRLMELCEMHGVEFDLVDTNETVKRLFAQLQEESASYRKLKSENASYSLPNPYESICSSVIDRCKFLLRIESAQAVAEQFAEEQSAAQDTLTTVPAIVADGTSPSRSGTANLTSSLHPSSAHPLSKSATHPPTASAQEREKRLNEDKKVTQDFGRRVDDLRRWLDAYSHWKNWQESSVLVKHNKTASASKKSAVDSILSFVSNFSLAIREFEQFVELHESRAKSRERGLRTFSALLQNFGDNCFGSLLHQLLNSLRLPLRDGGHYLDNIEACGESMRKQVCDAFRDFFGRIVAVAGNASRDPLSRLLAVRVCTMTFLDQDVSTLMTPSEIKCSVFELLQQVLLEPSPSFNPAPFVVRSMSSDEDDGSEEATRQREKRAQAEANHKRLMEEQAQALKKRHDALRDSAWTSLRLLATQCFGWSISSESPSIPKALLSQVMDAQEHVYRLMSSELKRLSSNLKKTTAGAADRVRDGEQCFQLLSLMYLLGAAGPLARPENVENLLSILSIPSTAPRVQRLILRLFRRILPTMLEIRSPSSLSSDSLATMFLDQVASWVFKGKLTSGEAPATSDAPRKDKEKVDSPSLKASDGGPKPDSYGVHLHNWTGGHKRLIEVCINTLGPEFLMAMASNPSSGSAPQVPAGGRIAASTLDAKAQQFINDMATNGTVTIKQGTQDQCNRLAQALASAGGTVTVAPVVKESAPAAPSSGAANSLRSSAPAASGDQLSWESSTMDGDTVFWVNGHVSEALASEYIALVRYLIDSSPSMLKSIQEALVKYCSLTPQLASALASGGDSPLEWGAIEKGSFSRCLASLCVLSGFKESIRVGGKVHAKQSSNAAPVVTALLPSDDQDDRLAATVVNFDATLPAKVEVIFDSDLDNRHVTKLDARDARAVPEIPLDASQLLSVTTKVLPSLLDLLQAQEPVNKQNKWLFSEIRCRALDALNNLLQESRAAEYLISDPKLAESSLSVLIKMAQTCDPAAHTLQLERHFVALSQRLWDIQTSPFRGSLSTTKPMIALLPHFPHRHKADLLPTAFEKGKQSGLIFWGHDLRTVEMANSAAAPAPSGGRGGRSMFGSSGSRPPRASTPTEVIVLGNAIVPLDGSIPDYYYEVTVETADSSPLISIGFVPEGSSSWGVGSYKFQANRVKSYYSGGNKRQEAYGSYIRAKDVIGCGWNASEKTIFYTRNGEELGTAFANAFPGGSADRIVPAVGVSKSVRVRINFGQEPFKYNVEANTALDEQTREARRKEAEERRKKEIEEEEARRKKDKEKEDAAKRVAAQPILNMGYSMKQALKALEQTGHQGAEPAVLWLLEHSDFNFDDEPEPDKPAEPPKPEVPAEAEKASESSKPDENKPADADRMDVDDSHPEDSYDSKSSSLFNLGDSFSYDVVASKESSQDQGNSEWEERVLPEVKNFMVKDGFSNLEVNDFMQQIRNELAQGHEAGARSIMQQIMGDAVSGIRFPSSAPRGGSAQPSLKINQVSVGIVLSVAKPQTVAEVEPVPSGRAGLASSSATGSITTSTLDKEENNSTSETRRSLLHPGAIGVVKAVQPQKQLVLLELYNTELAILEHWWVPVQALQKPSKVDSQNYWSKMSSVEQVQQMLMSVSGKLANVYARRIVISLIKNKAPLAVAPGSVGISIPDALNLTASEFLSATKVIVSAHPLLSDHGPPKGMDVIRERLAPTAIGANRSELSASLVTEACSLLSKAARMAAKSSTVVNSLSSPSLASGAWMVEISGARAIVVQFDRGGTNVFAGTRLSFYWDEDCTDLIKSFPEKSPLMPLAVPSSKFFVRIEGKKDREKSKFKFVAVPVSTDASLARWLVEYTLETNDSLDSEQAKQIFDAVTDFLYRSQSPSALKQSVMHLLARMLHRLRRRSVDAISPDSFRRLSKLKTEMSHLHDVEKRRADKPFSSYLQTLVELNVAVRMYELDMKSLKESQSTVKEDDAMFVAIALAKTLKAEKDSIQAAPKKSSPASAQTQAPVSVEEKPSDDEGEPSFDGLFGDDGDDEDAMLKMALQESMRLQEEQDEPKPVGNDGEKEPQSDEPDSVEQDESSGGPFGDGMDVDDEEALRAAIAMSMAEGDKPDAEKSTPADAGTKSPTQPAQSSPPHSPGVDSSDAGGGESDMSFNLFGDALGTPIPPPPPPGQKASGSFMGPPAPPSDDPAWFTQLVLVAQALETLCFRDDNNRQQTKVLSDLARRAWTETRKDSVKERLVVLEDIPSVPAEKRREFMTLIEEAVDDCAQVTEGSLFVPVDPATKMTRKFAVLELQSLEKVNTLIEKLSKDIKLRVPRFVLHPGSGLSSSSDNVTEVKAFAIRGTRFMDAEAKAKAKAAEAQPSSSSAPSETLSYADVVKEFLRGKLFDEETRALTPLAREAFTEVFLRFNTDHTTEGVLCREQLEELQYVCTGQKLTDEEASHFLSTYEVKKASFNPDSWSVKYAASAESSVSAPPAAPATQAPTDATSGLASPRTGSSFSDLESDDDAMDVDLSGSGLISRNPSSSSLALGPLKEVSGLTLKGFIDLWTLQSAEEPISTWDELYNLGYDLRLNLNSFSDAKDAVRAVARDRRLSHLSMDEELVRYAEQLYAECELTSPIQLTTAHISPLRPDSHMAQLYPKWARMPLPTMRLRFEILRQLNSRVQLALPLVDLGGAGLLPQLVSRSRAILFHAVKMQFFYEVLDKTSVQGSQPTVEIDRLRLASRKEGADPSQLYGTEEALLKNTAFGIVFRQLRQTDPALFRQKKPPGTEPHFSLKVDFKGEHVEGEGGPYRQFFTDVSKELTKVLPLLIPCPNAQAKVGRNRDKFIVAPSCNSRFHLRMFRFLGQLMGMAIRTGVMLTVDLPSFFWKPLVEQPLTLTDLREIDHAFYGTLKFIRACEQSALDEGTASIFQKFSVLLSDKMQVLLKPHGDKIDLTYSNREEYLRLAEAARLNEATAQMAAIRRGLAEVVPVSLLNLCSWQDLEWRVCGRPQIDIKLLKRHTTYSAVSPSAPHIKYFWQVLKSFSQADRRAFVRFAWAQERLPGDDQEFERTQTRMLIKPFTGTSHPDSTFPRADTCFFNLSLPEYSSPEILRERLLFAIHTDADSMDADERNQEPEQEIRGLPREFFFR